MGASFSLPKQWVNGEVLSHSDLNSQFNTILDNVQVASGIAGLDGSALVINDPVNATATKAAGKICKWGTSEAFQCSALTATQVTASIAIGTAPLVITSTTKVANLNVDAVDGFHASATSGDSIIPVADASGDIHLNFIPDTLTGKTVATCTSLAMTGENSATSATSPVDLDLGSVTDGDAIFVQVVASLQASATASYRLTVSKASGTATILVGNTHTEVDSPIALEGNIGWATTGGPGMCCVVQVSGTGTLVMRAAITEVAATLAINNIQIYAFFLKKQ